MLQRWDNVVYDDSDPWFTLPIHNGAVSRSSLFIYRDGCISVWNGIRTSISKNPCQLLLYYKTDNIRLCTCNTEKPKHNFFQYPWYIYIYI